METAYFGLFVCLIRHVCLIGAFQIKRYGVMSNSGHGPPFKPNSSITLKCSTTGDYEHCNWVKNGVSIVKYEWVSVFGLGGSLQRQYCKQDVCSRLHQVGNYDNHECFIKLTNVMKSDEGSWSCMMQEYQLGLNSGAGTDQKSISVTIDQIRLAGRIKSLSP